MGDSSAACQKCARDIPRWKGSMASSVGTSRRASHSARDPSVRTQGVDRPSPMHLQHFTAGDEAWNNTWFSSPLMILFSSSNSIMSGGLFSIADYSDSCRQAERLLLSRGSCRARIQGRSRWPGSAAPPLQSLTSG